MGVRCCESGKPLSLNFCQALCTRCENTSDPHPTRIRTTSKPHPNHVRTTSELHPNHIRNNGYKWGVAKKSSISWVAKLKGDKSSGCKLSKGRSRSYREIKLRLSAGNERVWSYRDKSEPQSSMDLYDPWISGPVRVSRKTRGFGHSPPLNWGGPLVRFSSAVILFHDNELKCSKCCDYKAETAFRTSRCCNR